MQLPKGATVAVMDGENLRLFRNSGDEATTTLAAMADPSIHGDNKSSGSHHQSSSANPDESRMEEDSFTAATAAWLNKEVLENRIKHLLVIAAPKSLGELRRHYHKALQAILLGEVSKDLAGSSIADITTAVGHA